MTTRRTISLECICCKIRSAFTGTGTRRITETYRRGDTLCKERSRGFETHTNDDPDTSRYNSSNSSFTARHCLPNCTSAGASIAFCPDTYSQGPTSWTKSMANRVHKFQGALDHIVEGVERPTRPATGRDNRGGVVY